MIECLRRSILDLKGLDNIRASNEKRKEKKEGMMNEIYTCPCGGQTWLIFKGKVCCNKCGKTYGLEKVGGSIPYTFENPKDFNERIKKENDG